MTNLYKTKAVHICCRHIFLQFTIHKYYFNYQQATRKAKYKITIKNKMKVIAFVHLLDFFFMSIISFYIIIIISYIKNKLKLSLQFKKN